MDSFFSGVQLHFTIDQEMMIASADSFACDYESINRMFERITTQIQEEEQKENIRLFFGNRGKPLAWLREANL